VSVLFTVWTIGLVSNALAQATAEKKVAVVAPAQPAAEPRAAAKPALPVPLESRPYKIRAFVSFDPLTRIDGRARDQKIGEWKTLVGRLVGPVWSLEIADSDGPASAYNLEELTPNDLKPLGTGVDKVWILQGRMSAGTFIITGRELDVETGWLGSFHSRPVPYLGNLTRELFKVSEDIFAPFAEIGEPKGDVVPIRVQGSALPRPLGTDVLAPLGSIFRPIRVFFKEDGSVLSIEKIIYSYLRVVTHEGVLVNTSLIRGIRDPLTKRISRKNKLVALGIKPAPVPTRLRFIRVPDKAPAAGYVLNYRRVPDGPFRELATTDREGRVSIPPGFADGLVILRLIAGKAEPMFDLPVMPGETTDEVTIPFEPRPQAIALQSQLDALRDSILDLVAVRSRLERRMKARESGDDWAGVEETLVEYRKLPPKDIFVKRLEQLQADAQKIEATSRTIVLTKNNRAQIADTQSLITRYLDDELFAAYEDAVVRSKEREARLKTTGKAASKVSVAATKKVEPVAPAESQPKAAPTTKPAVRPAAAAPSGITPF
jgi:hypothetical protein